MSRFDRYLLSQLLALFGFFALILVAVYWLNRAVGLFDRLLGDGQSALVFLEFSLLILPNAIRLVLPIAAFIATVYLTNRLLQESELVVMQATGFSAFRLARPVLYFGLIIMVLHLILMGFLVPWSTEIYNSRQRALSDDIAARYMNKGQFMQPAKGVTLYIRDITGDGELVGVFLADDRSAKVRKIFNAKRALILQSETGPKLLMFDGSLQTLDLDGGRRLSVTRFADATQDMRELIRKDSVNRGPSPRDMTTTSLLSENNGLDRSKPKVADEITRELHLRFSQPLLSLASAVMGFSILMVGAFSRFGLWRQIAAAVLALIVVQLLGTSATSLVMEDAGKWPALYAPPLLGCLFAACMLWWSQRPRHVRRGVVPA